MSLIKNSTIITFFNVSGILLSFFSNIVIASKFGAGTELDVYLAASTLPLYINSVLISILSFTFIPVFTEYKNKSQLDSWNIVSSFINLSIIATSTLILFGIIFSEAISSLLYPGFSADKIAQTANLQNWYLPTTLFTLLNELMASVYYANEKFFAPSFNKIISPLLIMIFVTLFADKISTKSIVIAILISTILQCFILSIGFARNKSFQYKFIVNPKHPGVKKIFSLMIPLLLGTFIYRGISVYDRFVLSHFSDGAISIVNYSTKIISMIPPIIISGIATAIFPKLSEYFSINRLDLLKQRVESIIRFTSFMMLPIIVFISAYSLEIIKIIFERGKFTHGITLEVAKILSLHILILWPSSIGTFMGQCFYSIQQTKISAFLGAIEAIIYMLICFPIAKMLGIKGVIIATIFDWYFSLLLSTIVLKRLLKWDINYLMKYNFKIICVCTILYCILNIFVYFEISIFLAGLLFVILFIALLKFVGADNEINLIKEKSLNFIQERI